MTTERNLSDARSGVRSYRGRTLEEILPQIRAELGADAIILREREGLVGGVGGFFAQRFIEVDARRGDGQSIDVYDDDAPENDLGGYADGAEADDRFGSQAETEVPAESDEFRVTRQEAQETRAFQSEPPTEPPTPSEPRPFIPPSVHTRRNDPPPPAPASVPEPESTPEPPASTRRFETGIFMERLREASAALPEDGVELSGQTPTSLSPAPAPAAGPPPVVSPPTFARSPQEPPPAYIDEQAEIDSALAELAEPTRALRPPRPQPKPAKGRKPRPPRAPRTPPAGRRAARSVAAPRPEPTIETPTEPIVAASAQPIAPETPVQPATPPQPALAPPPVAPAPAQPASPPVANPYEYIRERPSVAPPRPSRPAPRPQPERTGSSAIGPRRYTAPPPSVMIEPSRRGGSQGIFRSALSRLLGRRKEIVLRPPPPQPLDLVAAAEVAENLSTRGASEAWTSELISAAGAHGNPLTGNLRAAAEAEVARRILTAPPLPATGAAVAFIGAGGSGKTRCTAAMASAYRRGSTLTVMVVAVDNPDGARELRKLLTEDGVPVVSLTAAQAPQAIEAGRQGGLVIVDTAATTPTDPAAVEALGAKLEPLRLDATYVTLPATLGPSAARRVLASFGTLDPAAVTITHADETDQLAVVVELAINHKIPLAYFHSGTDHRNALSAIDPPAIAQELLP